MSMGLVDTIMVGPLGPAAIAATGMGNAVFSAIAIFGMGLLLGLDAFVSHAYGAGDRRECRRWLHQGAWLGLALSPPIMALTVAALATLDWWGLHPEIRVLVGPYLRVVSVGTLPLLLYAASRRYLQGTHIVRPIVFALVSANVVNLVANWALIYGHMGLPALGVEGSAWATTVSRVYLAAFLYGVIRAHHRQAPDVEPVSWTLDSSRIRRLLVLGLPAASQVTLEVGVFAAATALAGRLDPVSSGSHQIALNLVSLAFMVPLGLSAAAAVRVAYNLGAGNDRAATESGWTALGVGVVLMSGIGLAFLLLPVRLIAVFSTDPRIIDTGVGLLAIAAAVSIFDGTQVVATGALRGLGDTRMPMMVNIVGHWVFGLPVGYALCFRFGWGVAGLWIGLSMGLTITAVLLTAVWWKRTGTNVHAL